MSDENGSNRPCVNYQKKANEINMTLEIRVDFNPSD